MLDSGSGTVVIVGIGVRVTVVVRRDERHVPSVGKVEGGSVRRDGRWVSSVGKVEGGSIEPLLLSVAAFGRVLPIVLAVVESSVTILAQLGNVLACTSSWQMDALRYRDCMSRNSLLLGVSSVPLDNSAWQKYHPASLSSNLLTCSWRLTNQEFLLTTILCWKLYFLAADSLWGCRVVNGSQNHVMVVWLGPRISHPKISRIFG